MTLAGEGRHHAFPPHADAETRVLILGSLPGAASLAAHQYYAHPQNQFWRLVGGAIGSDLAAMAYPARLAALTAAGIGLWDVIASARRPGSLDGAIRAAETRDLAGFAATLPALRMVAFNGATAARYGRGALAGSGVVLLDLPSSSAAHARLSLAAKQAAWNAIADCTGMARRGLKPADERRMDGP